MAMFFNPSIKRRGTLLLAPIKNNGNQKKNNGASILLLQHVCDYYEGLHWNRKMLMRSSIGLYYVKWHVICLFGSYNFGGIISAYP
jgi:hypothetical protein